MAVDHAHAAAPRGEPARRQRDADAAHLVGDERLPCGRLVTRVWERARSGRDDPHAIGCPYCREAAEGLAALDRTAPALRTEHPSARTVAERVVRAVRAEVRLGRMLPLDDPERDLRIVETAAAKVLRRAADRVPGVRAASCRLTLAGAGTSVAVAMSLAMTLDQPLPARVAEVRRAVASAARRELGLNPGSIDLDVATVLEPFRPPETAEARTRDRSGR